jgi:hypothetical protein
MLLAESHVISTTRRRDDHVELGRGMLAGIVLEGLEVG